MAGNRCFEVYSGIDVFGRGTFGGGGFSTNVALANILNKGPNNDENNNTENKAWTSVGLFAPGWTFEEAKDWYDYQIRESMYGCIRDYDFT